MNTTAGTGIRPPFTASQWQELEEQALIFKYMMAGIPVPPDLLLPIRRSLESARFFHHPGIGYCSFYGKKADPEPGRCRRTDGKKWRCSKDAYPESKYCERHMHRGRNRSRKPVETQTISQSSSTMTSLTPTTGGAGTTPSNFQNLPLHSAVSNPQGGNPSQLQVDPTSYSVGNKDYRYLHGMKGEVDEHSFFSEASGSLRSLGMDSSLDSSWRLMPNRVSSFPSAKPRNGSVWPSNYPQVQGLPDMESATITSAMSKQQQHCFFGSEFSSAEPVKQESQSLRPFFDEWPKARDPWTDLEDERSNRTAFSTTQLSISIPMASSDFSATSSRSPQDD
ncbi:growth-regulating factor 4-like [Aristolochia californica]|uniref:growth-regulating factor 4-like n=1 Tax=Aristolochia californica TaxID=171875 RepID=UPI0035D7D6C9